MPESYGVFVVSLVVAAVAGSVLVWLTARAATGGATSAGVLIGLGAVTLAAAVLARSARPDRL